MKSCIIEKVNNSITIKLITNLLHNLLKIAMFSARHNSMTKFCSALFKNKN